MSFDARTRFDRAYLPGEWRSITRRLADFLWTFLTVGLIVALATVVGWIGNRMIRQAAFQHRDVDGICSWCSERGAEEHPMRFRWADEVRLGDHGVRVRSAASVGAR